MFIHFTDLLFITVRYFYFQRNFVPCRASYNSFIFNFDLNLTGSSPRYDGSLASARVHSLVIVTKLSAGSAKPVWPTTWNHQPSVSYYGHTPLCLEKEPWSCFDLPRCLHHLATPRQRWCHAHKQSRSIRQLILSWWASGMADKCLEDNENVILIPIFLKNQRTVDYIVFDEQKGWGNWPLRMFVYVNRKNIIAYITSLCCSRMLWSRHRNVGLMYLATEPWQINDQSGFGHLFSGQFSWSCFILEYVFHFKWVTIS